MRPYEGVAVPDSERIEQAAEELEARFSLGSDFCFTLHFDALPPITWLTPYSQLEVRGQRLVMAGVGKCWRHLQPLAIVLTPALRQTSLPPSFQTHLGTLIAVGDCRDWRRRGHGRGGGGRQAAVAAQGPGQAAGGGGPRAGGGRRAGGAT